MLREPQEESAAEIARLRGELFTERARLDYLSENVQRVGQDIIAKVIRHGCNIREAIDDAMVADADADDGETVDVEVLPPAVAGRPDAVIIKDGGLCTRVSLIDFKTAAPPDQGASASCIEHQKRIYGAITGGHLHYEAENLEYVESLPVGKCLLCGSALTDGIHCSTPELHPTEDDRRRMRERYKALARGEDVPELPQSPTLALDAPPE